MFNEKNLNSELKQYTEFSKFEDQSNDMCNFRTLNDDLQNNQDSQETKIPLLQTLTNNNETTKEAKTSRLIT